MEKTVYRDPNRTPNRAPRPKKRRPHWGRILGAALALVVLVAAVALLPKLLQKGPRPDADGQADPTTNSAVNNPDAQGDPVTNGADGQGDPVANGADAQGTTGEEDGFVAPVAEHGDLLTLANATSINPHISATTADGYYYLSREKGLPEGVNIKYIDYATQAERFLCSDPNCTHDTESCTSYVAGGIDIFVGYQHLYTSSWKSGVQVRDLDGSNCRTLFTPENALGVLLAVDRDRLYYLRNTYGDSLNIVSRVLECVNVDTGEVQPLYTMRDTDAFFGTCGPYILLMDCSQDMYHLFAIDLQGQEVPGLYFPEACPDEQARDYVTDKGLLYHFTFEPCTITEWNIYTGKTRVLAEDFPVSDYADTWISAAVNGYLPISTTIRPNKDDLSIFTSHTYILDLSTGNYTENTLTRDLGGGVTEPLYFLAETNGRYLVYPYDREVSVHPAGASEATTVSCPAYAFISKEDLLANRPNYTEVTQTS